jgi:hypothetical protein
MPCAPTAAPASGAYGHPSGNFGAPLAADVDGAAGAGGTTDAVVGGGTTGAGAAGEQAAAAVNERTTAIARLRRGERVTGGA